MEKEKFSFTNVVKTWKPEYMSIIFLTIHYQGEKGLRLLHYRYALVKNDEISNGWKQEMKEFFGWKLKQLYALQEIKKCITTRQNLVKKLQNLVEWNVLEVLPKNDERDYPLYRINKKNYKKIDFILRKNKIKKLFEYKVDHCSEKELNKIEKNIEDLFLENQNDSYDQVRGNKSCLSPTAHRTVRTVHVHGFS